jgi:alpha-beta hydrolase superfamily lysophospholipase
VIGFDMRGFGESEGPRATITNPQDMLDDSVIFLKATKQW